MPAVSHQTSLIVATIMLALAIIGVFSQIGKGQRRNGIIMALSWGTLLLSILVILSNDAFSQFILNELTRGAQR